MAGNWIASSNTIDEVIRTFSDPHLVSWNSGYGLGFGTDNAFDAIVGRDTMAMVRVCDMHDSAATFLEVSFWPTLAGDTIESGRVPVEDWLFKWGSTAVQRQAAEILLRMIAVDCPDVMLAIHHRELCPEQVTISVPEALGWWEQYEDKYHATPKRHDKQLSAVSAANLLGFWLATWARRRWPFANVDWVRPGADGGLVLEVPCEDTDAGADTAPLEELDAKLGDYVRTAWRTAFNANESLQVEKQDGSMLWIPTSAAYCVTSSIAEPDDWATGVWAADGCADERRCAIGDHPTLYDALLACRAAYLNF